MHILAVSFVYVNPGSRSLSRCCPANRIQEIVTGLIIVAAVTLDRLRRR